MVELLLGLGVVTIAVAVLLYYGNAVRRVLREEREAADIIKDIVRELSSRIAKVEKEMTERYVRLEVAELRLSRLELSQVHPSKGIQQTVVTQEIRGARTAVPKVLSVPISPAEARVESLSPTEVRVLDLLRAGNMTPREMQDKLGRSREHTSRLLKDLHERGYLLREEKKKPYNYSLSARGQRALA